MKHELPEGLDGERIDRVVSMLTGRSRSDAAALVADGGVRLDGEVVVVRSTRVRAGAVVELAPTEPQTAALVAPEPAVPVDVVHVDADVVVVDKPAGIVVHPGAGNRDGTLIAGVVARYPEVSGVGEPSRPGVVHRIDQGTSGLLVIARSARAHTALVEQFGSRSVVRRYVALAWGTFASPRGVIDAAIGRSGRDPTRMAVSARGRDARTAYEVTSRWDDPEVTLVSCRLETGRTHQIRVHLAAIGHPVVGDARYRGMRPGIDLDRPFLHAVELGFVHPGTGEPVRFASELPADLQHVLDGLGPARPGD